MEINEDKKIVAYLSMEIAIASEVKTYAGGLGVLAGDILRAASDLNFPMVGLTLLNREGYFKQAIAPDGQQISSPDTSYDFSLLEKMNKEVTVEIGKEKVKVGVWRYVIKSGDNLGVPVYFLDTDIPGNRPTDRRLTGKLYGGDEEYRLKQEIILGRAGVKMLAELGYQDIKKYHLNEGHGALAAVELFLNYSHGSEEQMIKSVRQRCVFTTHTPLEKEQDIFSLPYFLEYQPDFPERLNGLVDKDKVNLTRVGLYFSAYNNAVSKRHQEVTQEMFPGYKIQAITNGVDSQSWVALEFKELYDRHIPGWQKDNKLLNKAGAIPLAELWSAHQKSKERLLRYVDTLSIGSGLKEEILTLGFVRRFAPYKRPRFLFTDISRLLEVQAKSGKIQIIYAGKAHPQDLEGRALIKQIWQLKKEMANQIEIVFLEDYDLDKARLLVAGVDLWLNTPLPPNEASGTSGMKAAHNGVPQLSTDDGWWPEGYKKDRTGWLIEETDENRKNNLYDLLEKEILPTYYRNPEKWREMMRFAISVNAAHFNTQRVLGEYIVRAYK